MTQRALPLAISQTHDRARVAFNEGPAQIQLREPLPPHATALAQAVNIIRASRWALRNGETVAAA